ncbi:hypothetical protein HNQ68_002298 [Pseudochrobactrum saccharolyticum]|uniref:DUF3168 domain-containing protein n=1 Tax=Pseudochrobactrum saccharolyticum TaxID=354352 RepID=A0A7W8EQT3_9HYPH|nr:DUF3168 domain-containing protein [Pseudochrobactrum saccharolyticum]KAB0538472.1 DUF3168 domain-containing protein [Pseudochrobactrum saccharolyticum]MBB5091757.1 hypothetical protein [Pseudochrobactrum saccharolyticum]
MSVSVSLQDVILNKLQADQAIVALVGSRIYDGVPENAEFPYISFGATDYSPDDADCIAGRHETIQLDCWSRDQGRKWPCKALADAVKKALHDIDADMSNGALVSMTVTLVRVIDDPDGITAHGIVQVTAIIEDE